jgi:PAS domain S-box-containing protein
MKTKSRLTLLLGVMLLLVTALSIISLATIWRLRGEGMALIKANYNSITYMQEMLHAVDTEGNPGRRLARLKEQLALQQQNVTEHQEADATALLTEAVAKYSTRADSVTETNVLRRAIAGVMEVNRAAIVNKAKEQEALGQQAVLWISITATLAFVIAFSLFMSMPTFLAEPIRLLTDGIDRIATGHYTERVMLPRNDEFGHMADRFNTMAGELERWSTSNLAKIMAEKARAEAVINSLSDPSIGVDEGGSILFMNRQAADLLGVDLGELAGRKVDEAMKENDLLARIIQPTAGTAFKAVLDGREQQFTVEADPIISEHGPAGTVYTLHNVTPFLERDQAKTMFLATISHELKTPLASTDIGLGLLERQQATRLTADQAAILSDLRKDHQRLVRIVSELLDMAQVETGRVRVNLSEQDLPLIAQEAVAALQATANARQVKLELRLAEDVPMVLTDADKATWSLINLVSNAVRHGPAHSTVTIACDVQEKEVLLSVSDQGAGLTAEQQARLFERFAPPTGSGTGLGLAIARELMRAMGGDITYRQGVPSGAVFTMHFAKALSH